MSLFKSAGRLPSFVIKLVGQVFEVVEEEVLLRRDIGGTSDDRKYRATHHRVFSQSLPVLLFEI